MHLFSADAKVFSKKIFFAPENMKKTPSKVANNRPTHFFFQYCQRAQNHPKSHFLFHENVSRRDFYIMTLIIIYVPEWIEFWEFEVPCARLV